MVFDVQHEVGVRNLEILNNSTDAQGRKLEVYKVHCPPPLFRTYRESAGVDVSPFLHLHLPYSRMRAYAKRTLLCTHRCTLGSSLAQHLPAGGGHPRDSAGAVYTWNADLSKQSSCDEMCVTS